MSYLIIFALQQGNLTPYLNGDYNACSRYLNRQLPLKLRQFRNRLVSPATGRQTTLESFTTPTKPSIVIPNLTMNQAPSIIEYPGHKASRPHLHSYNL